MAEHREDGLSKSQGSIKQIRENERRRDVQATIRAACSEISLPLYLVFWIADWIYAPDLKWEFLALRSLMVPINLAVFRWIGKPVELRAIEGVALAFTFANSIIITIMIYVTERASSPYYAGLNLVALGLLSFVPWSRRMLPLVIATIFGPYYVSVLVSQMSGRDMSNLVLNSFFICGNIVASLVIRHFNEQLRTKELTTRLQLEEEIRSRERIIKQKTDEALKLSNLMKQFSPQVVHAIQNGELDINKTVSRAKICVVFADIVNSTDRVVRIDKDDFNKVLSLFMEDTIKVMLKYDITIDKFLGDGVLAFSNAPMQYPDYVERVVNASIEIRDRIQAHQEMYLEHWLNEFQIRLGIASGFANVGFYGIGEHFKSYTAIGKVMNLACRLCSEAAPDQIIASQEVVRDLPEFSYKYQDLGYKRLKGFESDVIKAFEITGGAREAAGGSEIVECPQGHGILHLDTNALGIYMFKCRVCGFLLEDGGSRMAA